MDMMSCGFLEAFEVDSEGYIGAGEARGAIAPPPPPPPPPTFLGGGGIAPPLFESEISYTNELI